MVLDRERRTLTAMIQLYCRGHHDTQATLCEDCLRLERYAFRRLDNCVFGAEKPVCAKCPVHCYNRTMRQRIQEVMRYAGPRMALRHPILAAGHVLDKRKSVPKQETDNGHQPVDK